MVKICTDTYPTDSESKYSEHFQKYTFPLSDFQKYAIEGITEQSHVLVTAHTGSGKTLPAEFGIEFFTSQNKKIIYTSPIKALSNQKFYEFQNKYPEITFGLLTGDIKTNPSAQVLIMTTEILMNTLYLKSNPTTTIQADFSMDFENELGCVIFDEVHYINSDRGHVWEKSIMMLPKHVQMIMLSATIDKAEEFANWVECIKQKPVYLCPTNHRVVPLTHYSFLTVNSGIFKKIKDKALEQEIKNWTNKLQLISSSSGQFNDLTLKTNNRFIDLCLDKDVYVSRAHVLNDVCKYMVEHEMLPGLCFVLSRKQLEVCAKEITVPLLEFDSKVAYTIRYECEQIIRKLPNYQEYLELPEYLNMVALLEKGIAIHHSGVMPVLKEMVELLYGKGYIKLLFATETFSIGVNMPTKTVIFTDITKYDGNIQRMLYSHEYTQMAGRAGRRGIDSVGHVIHLPNLFRKNIIDSVGYKGMMSGKPQQLVSKFKISYDLVLNLILNGLVKNTDFVAYAKNSMIQLDLAKQLNCLDKQIADINFNPDLAEPELLRTSFDTINEYIELVANSKNLVNKKRKEAERRIQQIKNENKYLDYDVDLVKRFNEKRLTYNQLSQDKSSTENYLNSSVLDVTQYLTNNNYIYLQTDELVLTDLGKIAAHLREVHCLVFATLINTNAFDKFEPNELVGIFSCFTNVGVLEDLKSFSTEEIEFESIKQILNFINLEYGRLQDDENKFGINSGLDYLIHYDLVKYVLEWCACTNVNESKLVLQKLKEEKGVFLGEFVKAILKIVNIANEMIKVCEAFGKISLLHKLKQIPDLVLKFVATNQSLYV